MNPFLAKTYDFIAHTKGLRRLSVPFQRERSISKGNDYPEKTFYIIRWMNGDEIGMMAIVVHVVCHIYYAKKKGYIPIVDMKNYRNPYMDRSLIGHENAWEYYFEQPEGYSLEDVRHAKNIVLSAGNIVGYDTTSEDEKENITQQYIRYNKDIKAHIDSYRNGLFGTARNVCGIKLRGTDYLILKPYAHAVQPTIDQAISIIKEKFNEWNEQYDKLFLATEDSSIIRSLKNEFGEKLSTLNIERFEAGETWHKTRKYSQQKKQSGEDYCVEMGILSSCDALIASECNGSLVALWMNGKQYKHYYMIDLGRYS